MSFAPEEFEMMSDSETGKRNYQRKHTTFNLNKVSYFLIMMNGTVIHDNNASGTWVRIQFWSLQGNISSPYGHLSDLISSILPAVHREIE